MNKHAGGNSGETHIGELENIHLWHSGSDIKVPEAIIKPASACGEHYED